MSLLQGSFPRTPPPPPTLRRFPDGASFSPLFNNTSAECQNLGNACQHDNIQTRIRWYWSSDCCLRLLIFLITLCGYRRCWLSAARKTNPRHALRVFMYSTQCRSMDFVLTSVSQPLIGREGERGERGRGRERLGKGGGRAIEGGGGSEGEGGVRGSEREGGRGREGGKGRERDGGRGRWRKEREREKGEMGRRREGETGRGKDGRERGRVMTEWGGREREGRERDREEGGIEGVREGREKWTGHYRNGSLHTCIWDGGWSKRLIAKVSGSKRPTRKSKRPPRESKRPRRKSKRPR